MPDRLQQCGVSVPCPLPDLGDAQQNLGQDHQRHQRVPNCHQVETRVLQSWNWYFCKIFVETMAFSRKLCRAALTSASHHIGSVFLFSNSTSSNRTRAYVSCSVFSGYVSSVVSTSSSIVTSSSSSASVSISTSRGETIMLMLMSCHRHILSGVLSEVSGGGGGVLHGVPSLHLLRDQQPLRAADDHWGRQ